MKSYTLRPDTVTHTELQCYSCRYKGVIFGGGRCAKTRIAPHGYPSLPWCYIDRKIPCTGEMGETGETGDRSVVGKKKTVRIVPSRSSSKIKPLSKRYDLCALLDDNGHARLAEQWKRRARKDRLIPAR